MDTVDEIKQRLDIVEMVSSWSAIFWTHRGMPEEKA
jgi:hypothetical protein